ncbi:hypothetical protein BTO02_14970 [Paraburkholderia sp. SOS3]|jgi:hypothetical protein|nr:hypothetical protein BTO02_14970 [Paraburkholderia sp. SOS3]
MKVRFHAVCSEANGAVSFEMARGWRVHAAARKWRPQGENILTKRRNCRRDTHRQRARMAAAAGGDD